MKDQQDFHRQRVDQIAEKVRDARERGESPALYHGQSHSARPDDFADEEQIHLEQLDHVIAVDQDAMTITVEPDVTMRELVDAAMDHGMIPHVVPEFPAITVGGGIQGAAGESSCFRYGLFGKQARRFEIVTGDGEIVEVSPEEDAELFHGQFGAYGSLGILTAVELELLPSSDYVELTYYRVDGFQAAVDLIRERCDDPAPDYIDAIMFGPDRGVVMVGERTDTADHPVKRFTRARDEWFYLHADAVSREHAEHTETIPIRDYFFRYDIGSFWTLKGLFDGSPLPFNRLTRTLLHPILDTETAYGALIHAGNLSSTIMLQDIITPVDETAGFMDWITDRFGIFPLWMLPMAPDRRSPLAPNHLEADLTINVGIWGTPRTDVDIREAKQELEERATAIGARKTLYAQQFLSEEAFWSIYDRDRYTDLRDRYGAAVFTDVYTATHTDELPPPSRIKAVRALLGL